MSLSEPMVFDELNYRKESIKTHTSQDIVKTNVQSQQKNFEKFKL